MNASTNEVTVACGRFRSYPDALRHPSADAPANVRLLPAGRFGAIASFRCDRATPSAGWPAADPVHAAGPDQTAWARYDNTAYRSAE
jgi:hypothetical protein